MKRKDINALHGKTTAELIKDLGVLEKEFLKFNLDRKIKQVKNHRLGKNLRDDIARVKSVIRQKQIQERKLS